MASQVLTNAKLYVDEHDLSGQMNALAVEYGVDALDETTFGNDTRKHTGGLKTTTMSHEGYWAAGTDDTVFSRIGGTTVVTISSDGADAGEVAYLAQTLGTSYSPSAAVGELLGFSVEMEAAGPLVRGLMLANQTASGTASAAQQNLGAVAAGENVYGALHVTSLATGATLTMKIQSDSTTGFSAPTDRITFSAATGVTAEWGSAAGAITDQYWRATWTLTGGSASFIVSAGIGE